MPKRSLKQTPPSTAPSQGAKRGRPRESQNRQYDVVDATLTNCTKCKSTERTKYQGAPEILRQSFEDVDVVTVWRKCRCTKCGQWRKDKYVFREPAALNSAVRAE